MQDKQVKKRTSNNRSLDRHSDFAPDQMQLRLSRLETAVSLAAERATFGPGDAQRDQIAQDFADQVCVTPG
jgi:hypothetical protein